MSKRLLKIATIVFIAAMFSACASSGIGTLGFSGTHVKLDPVFWTKSSKIVIGITPYPIIGYTYKHINRNVYFVNLDSIDVTDTLDTGLTRFVKAFDYSQITNLESIFANELSKRGLQVLTSDDKALNAQYQYLLAHDASLDTIKILREQTTADYLILFQTTMCGIVNYPDLITRYRLTSIVGVAAYLIDLHSGRIEWKYLEAGLERRVSGEWDQPPDYLNIAKAIREAMTATTDHLSQSFFK